MRILAALLLTALSAAPLAAAPKPVAPPTPTTPPSASVVIPPELSDPAVADKLGRMAGVLARVMMDLPVGELEAAIEDRPATAADKAKTVRDVARLDDPDAERKIAADAALTGRSMQVATKALVASLPAIMVAMAGAREELEKAVANLPRPNYPDR